MTATTNEAGLTAGEARAAWGAAQAGEGRDAFVVAVGTRHWACILRVRGGRLWIDLARPRPRAEAPAFALGAAS
ncbi:MAG TPA: hypothetical protein VFS43_40735 [Polyangiaceae bacterium]|nr:hypothetical protein [Polyangiaceae bacterium]